MTSEGSLRRLGSELHFWVTGPRDGMVVAFTHGASLDHRSFDAQLPVLVDAGFQVVTWDMRGHGRSKPLGAEFTAATLAGDLAAILEQVDCDEAVVVGHSMGGYVAQQFVHEFPELARALVVIGSTDLSMTTGAGWRLMYKALPFSLKRMSLETFHRRTLADLAEGDHVKHYAANAMKPIPKADFVEIVLGGVRCLWFDSGLGDGYTIQIPFLLTHGDRDRANRRVFTKQSPRWAAKEPNCRYEVIADAGHTAHMDNPEGFNKVLLRFLDNLRPCAPDSAQWRR